MTSGGTSASVKRNRSISRRLAGRTEDLDELVALVGEISGRLESAREELWTMTPGPQTMDVAASEEPAR